MSDQPINGVIMEEHMYDTCDECRSPMLMQRIRYQDDGYDCLSWTCSNWECTVLTERRTEYLDENGINPRSQD